MGLVKFKVAVLVVPPVRVALKMTLAESVPVNALAPLVAETKSPRYAVYVPFPTPVEMMGVRDPATNEMVV
jgi:hypothetical protein